MEIDLTPSRGLVTRESGTEEENSEIKQCLPSSDVVKTWKWLFFFIIHHVLSPLLEKENAHLHANWKFRARYSKK